MQLSWKVFFVFFLVYSCSNEVKPNNAVVVTRHHLATDVGAGILDIGGK